VGDIGGRPLTRRAFVALLVAGGTAALLAADRPPGAFARPLPLRIDDGDVVRYLRALGDLDAATWTHLAITAAILDPGTSALRTLIGNLPTGNARTAAYDWTYRAESRRMIAILDRIVELFRGLLAPDRAAYYGGQLRAEQARLEAGGQVDYPGLSFLITAVNREQGLMTRPEIEDVQRIHLHRLDPRAQPLDVPTLLAERRACRDLAAAFRREAARLLGGAPTRFFNTAGGPLTLLADLGRPSGAGVPTYQLIRARLNDLDDTTIAAEAVYFTAGDFLGLEPATPPDRWADQLPPAERALAPTNALSPRLNRANILAPAHASRVLWASLQDCQAVVAALRALA
jgi:hypothetical protein